ncbi:MAG: yycN [Paenibacillaceae bacterium]|jgi:ribosomal protein S18 acetylase RimI-like enzyme|nr:yycN [Paenibacillaceae bacterium]
MNESELQAFLDFMIPVYAKDKVDAGTWKAEEAQQFSTEAYARLLPDGLATEGNYLYMIEEEAGTQVGFIWLYVEHATQEAFLYEITLYEEWRGRGLGKDTMAAMEQKAKELGAKAVGLHVFGHNLRALRLYEKSGYQTTDISMKKYL